MPPKVKYYLEERNQAFLNSLFYKILRVNLVKRVWVYGACKGLSFNFCLSSLIMFLKTSLPYAQSTCTASISPDMLNGYNRHTTGFD